MKCVADSYTVDWFYSLLLPSTFVRYWIDADGIMHQRVIPESEWRDTPTATHGLQGEMTW